MQETSGLIPPVNLAPLAWDFEGKHPYSWCAIDNFFDPTFARELASEFPAFDSDAWHEYRNPLEVKRTLNNWNAFGPATYRAMSFLNSAHFVELLRLSIKADYPLYSDPGLHGGGLHAAARGGRLNVHLDYSRHPKTGLARKINLLVYLTEDWQDEWGGALGLWEQNPVQPGPGALVRSIAPRFNRAVIFETPNAWHGLPEPIACPEGQVRKSLAVYYLTDPKDVAREAQRTRALFAPAPEQIGDAEVLDLIARRADETTAASVHRVNPAR